MWREPSPYPLFSCVLVFEQVDFFPCLSSLVSKPHPKTRKYGRGMRPDPHLFERIPCLPASYTPPDSDPVCFNEHVSSPWLLYFSMKSPSLRLRALVVSLLYLFDTEKWPFSNRYFYLLFSVDRRVTTLLGRRNIQRLSFFLPALSR